jgi:hypothetical protein
MTAMRKCPAAVVVLVALLVPAPARAWGYEAHRFIMDRGIGLLPPEIRPLFEKRRATLVERSIDPDLWRPMFGVEAPNHQMNIDLKQFGAYPFKELPRDYKAAVAKFGLDAIRGAGTVPWRIEELYSMLQGAFEEYGRRPNPSTLEEILLYAAAMTHYISDAHVPFHATENYDGQLTNQRGIHSRFETGMFTRFRSRLAITPKAIAPIADPRGFAFDTVIESARLAPGVLRSDLAAIGERDVYDDAYFDAFYRSAGPVLEARVNGAISATAALIAGAWKAAGSPALAVELSTSGPAKRVR